MCIRDRAKGVPVRFEDRLQIDRLVGTREHQGVAALGAAKPAMGLEDLLAAQTPQGLLVLLDGVEDPHNLGAVVRTDVYKRQHLVDAFPAHRPRWQAGSYRAQPKDQQQA